MTQCDDSETKEKVMAQRLQTCGMSDTEMWPDT